MRALTERRRRFVLAMAADPLAPHSDWARAAGYSDTGEGCKVRASIMLQDEKVKAAVREVAQATLGTAGPMMAVKALLDVVAMPAHDQRIKAAEAILNRIGMGEKQQIEITHRDLTGDALIERIRFLEAKYFGDGAKVIEHKADEFGS